MGGCHVREAKRTGKRRCFPVTMWDACAAQQYENYGVNLQEESRFRLVAVLDLKHRARAMVHSNLM